MCREEIIQEIKRQDKQIDECQSKKRELFKMLEEADDDFISVKSAARMLDVSEGTLYNRINSGILKSKRIGAVLRVRKSDVLAINDRG